MRFNPLKFVAPALVAAVMATPVVVVTAAPASAAGTLNNVTVKRDTNCDVRSPANMVLLSNHKKKLGFGVPDSDIIVWTKRNVDPGNYSVNLPKQGFGSSKTWVIVALNDAGKIQVSQPFTYTRPAKADCVAKQNPRFANYKTGVNKTCPAGSVKLFRIGIWVKPGTPGYILKPGVAELVKTNGVQINGEGYRVGTSKDRLVEYTLSSGRWSKIVKDPSQNGAWPVVTSSSRVALKSLVLSDCVEAA